MNSMSKIEFADPATAYKLDETKLSRYLEGKLPSASGLITARQFEGGHSNPTFLLTMNGGRYVLRKKPSGTLLATAHMVEREYKVMTALRDTGVPVPKTYLLCEDDSIIGTPFFVMEYLEGRHFWSPTLEGLSAEQRAAIFHEKCGILAALHNVNYKDIGLSDFGKPGEYIARQVKRWTRQYLAAQTEDIADMEKLMQWLPQNIPEEDSTCIIHGDFRIDNLRFHADEDRAVGILDWELSTLGHPLADLAYDCLHYHSNYFIKLYGESDHCLAEVAGPKSGIPTESQYVAEYCKLTGRTGVQDWTFYVVFSIFRLASITQGVYKRGLDGNASSTARALEKKHHCRELSDTAWKLVEKGISP